MPRATPRPAHRSRRPGAARRAIATALLAVLTLVALLATSLRATEPADDTACHGPVRAAVRVTGHGQARDLTREVEELAPLLYEIAAARTGAASCAPIDIDLVPDVLDAHAASSDWRLPRWAAGAARPDERRIVIGVTADRQLLDRRRVLLHELTHVAVASAARGAPLPRWFEEGVARVVASEDGDDDDRALAVAHVAGRELPLAAIERGMPRDRGDAALGYAVAGRAVRIIEARGGSDAIARVLAAAGGGAPFEDALVAVTGRQIWQLEVDVARSVTTWSAWATVLRGVDVWMPLAVLVAIVGAIGVRRRRKERLQHMDDDVPRAAPAPPFPIVLVRFRVGPRRAFVARGPLPRAARLALLA